MLSELGCELDEQTYAEIFDECDSHGDGTLSLDEFVTALGMLKRNVLEVMQLEQSFTRMRAHRLRKEVKRRSQRHQQPTPEQSSRMSLRQSLSTVGSSLMMSGGKYGMKFGAEEPQEPLRARCMRRTRRDPRISEAEAEMIFVTDLKDDLYIDFTEFKQVVNWSN